VNSLHDDDASAAQTTFLAPAVTGLICRDVQIVLAAYLAMALVTWSVIVPPPSGAPQR
jgi:hypothetical protein